MFSGYAELLTGRSNQSAAPLRESLTVDRVPAQTRDDEEVGVLTHYRFSHGGYEEHNDGKGASGDQRGDQMRPLFLR